MRPFLAIVASLLLWGCVGPAALKDHLEKSTAELKYDYPEPRADRGPGTVTLSTYTVRRGLPPTCAVEKNSAYAVPLLLFTYWSADYRLKLGANQVTNDYVRFMKESLAEQLRRSARRALVEAGGDLEVEVSVDVEQTGRYRQSGHFLFLGFGWSYGSGWVFEPATAVVSGELVARRGGREVLRAPVRGEAVVPFTKRSGPVFDDYTPAAVQGLGAAIKDFNANVVAALDAL